MSSLSPRDRELVALGAAMGSNCVPCIEYHIPEARKAGLSDQEMRTAVHLADQVRQVPARRTLEAALKKLSSASPAPGAPEQERAGDPAAGEACGCASPGA